MCLCVCLCVLVCACVCVRERECVCVARVCVSGSQVHERSSRLFAQLQATPKGRTLILEGGGCTTLVDLLHSPCQRARINAALTMGLFALAHPLETARVGGMRLRVRGITWEVRGVGMGVGVYGGVTWRSPSAWPRNKRATWTAAPHLHASAAWHRWPRICAHHLSACALWCWSPLCSLGVGLLALGGCFSRPDVRSGGHQGHGPAGVR